MCFLTGSIRWSGPRCRTVAGSKTPGLHDVASNKIQTRLKCKDVEIISKENKWRKSSKDDDHHDVTMTVVTP